MRRTYRERRDHLLRLLDRQLGDTVSLVPSFYGMHVAVFARDGTDYEAISEALARRGIMIHSLERYYLGPATRSGFIIGYAAAAPEMLDIAVEALAEEIAEHGFAESRRL